MMSSEWPDTADPVPGRPHPHLPISIPHVPRTGGTTLKEILEGSLGASRIIVDVHRYEALPDLKRFGAVEGHKITSFFERAFGTSWSANGFVMLRDPADRVVSAARRIRRHPSTPMYASFADEVTDPDLVFERHPQLCNLQTKYLAGRLMERSVDASDVEGAMSLLQRMAFGRTEQFDPSIALFAERFGVPLPVFGKSYATPKGSGDEDLRSEAFRVAALRYNEFDQELYARASMLFRDRVATYIRRLLELDLQAGTATARLEQGAQLAADACGDGEVYLAPDTTSTTISGWMLVDGHAPDAVLAASDSRSVTPLCARIRKSRTASAGPSTADQCSAFLGRLDVPLDADTVTLIAFDRRHGLRAEETFPVCRSEHRSFL